MSTIPTIVSRISTAIAKFVLTEESFTMLEVSNVVKADGGEFMTHTEIRDIARPIIDLILKSDDVYISTEIDVVANGKTVKANLYHPTHVSPVDYIKKAQTASAPAASQQVLKITGKDIQVVAPTVTVTAKQQIPVSGVNSTTVVARTDGAIEIPYSILKESDLEDDYVDIIYHPNSITIQSNVNGNARLYKGFRLSAKNLAKSNLKKNSVKISAYADKIVISA